MSAAAVLEQARAAGVQLLAGEDDKVVCRSAGELPEGLREAIVRHKAELLGLLRPDGSAELLTRLRAELQADLDAEERRHFPGGFPPLLRHVASLYVEGPTGSMAREELVAWFQGARRQALRLVERRRFQEADVLAGLEARQCSEA